MTFTRLTSLALVATAHRRVVGIRGFSSSSDDNDQLDNSGTQLSFGGALGWKMPAPNRLSARFEVGYQDRAEDEPDVESGDAIFLSFGLSFSRASGGRSRSSGRSR